MITLKSILVPTDFSKQSQTAIRYGIEFASKFGAKLHVLHVVQDVSIFIPEMGFINPSAALSNIEPMLLSAGKSLADFLEPYKHHGIELISHCQEGNPLDEIISLATDENVDLIILARYMQVLSDQLCRKLDGRVINIHHSFLPGFKGAKPYHRAYERGVKMVGATAHYVTPDLDEGPIITQDVSIVDHADTVDDLIAQGQETESRGLSRAVKLHLEHRVMLNGNRTIVFK
jgi:formyltetrahydrofolate deformylase